MFTAMLWNVVTWGGAWQVSEGQVVRELTTLGRTHEVVDGRPQYLPPDRVTIRWYREGAPSWAIGPMLARKVRFPAEQSVKKTPPRAAAPVPRAPAAPVRTAAKPAAPTARPAPVPLKKPKLTVRRLGVGPVIGMTLDGRAPTAEELAGQVREPLLLTEHRVDLAAPVSLEKSSGTGLSGGLAGQPLVEALPPAATPAVFRGPDVLPFTLPDGATVTWLADPDTTPSGTPVAMVTLKGGLRAPISNLDRAQATIDQLHALATRSSPRKAAG